MAERQLDEYAVKVLTAMKPDYDYLVLVIPSVAKVNEFAAGAALADLKKAGAIAFEGRGKFKSTYLTPEGVKLRAEALDA